MKLETANIDEISAVSPTALRTIAPALHSYALRRLRSISDADDVVQDTLERAWSARHAFRPGAELKPWIFAILNNVIINHYRRGKHLTEDVDGFQAGRLKTEADQLWRLHYMDTVAALEALSFNQKRALSLIVFGATTAEAAAAMGCPLGTLKSHL